jgi:DNA-binding NtrC family response regulator
MRTAKFENKMPLKRAITKEVRMSDSNAGLVLPSSQTQSPWAQTPLSAPTQKVSEAKAMIYKSDVMSQLMKMVERVAPSQANILVLGESGTGKELIARAIHDKSNRKNKPFVAINCGALRETLLESELFGHEKGSFTGAYTKKIGLAEAANGGTLFLDEVGELPMSIQAKLLRFLQEGEIFRVGGKDSIRVDLRIICATNRELDQEVTRGNFREDLFYRINTIVISAPPLRRRKEDIPVLVQHFLTQGNSFMNRVKSIDEEALAVMLKYDWPGNIRELQNACERLQVLSEGHTIMVNDLPDSIRMPQNKDESTAFDPAVPLYELEKRYIIKALAHYGGNKTQAAQGLGITIKTLYNKLHEYGEFEKYAVHTKPEVK